MTVRLYQRDPYLFEFEARVEELDDGWVRLDASAFYPGGGGQEPDRGTIHGLPMTEVSEKDDHIWHLVPGNPFSVGHTVWCSVDWDHRYDIMRGHTAEHMLFGALNSLDPDLELVKIDISDEHKRLTVTGDVDRDLVERAEGMVNKAIADNLEVTRYEMDREEAEESGVRAKMERIEGDTVDVVEIGDFDCAACAGIHVMETGELSALLVDRVSSAGRGSTNIDFRVGEDAVSRSMELAHLALRAAESLACPLENLSRTLDNLTREVDEKRGCVTELSRHALENIPAREMAGLSVHAAVLPGVPRKEMIRKAESLRDSDGAAILVSKGDRVEFVMSSPEDRGTDLRLLIDRVVRPMGGSGGGRPDFVQGGLPDTAHAEDLLQRLVDALRDLLQPS